MAAAKMEKEAKIAMVAIILLAYTIVSLLQGCNRPSCRFIFTFVSARRVPKINRHHVQ